ncbi:hypothetical protein V9T40_004178 [Parthenolecanium corni]|uniref:Uncharacterized protein n=1 Tax=Parthenolecanium corni TaxID=536013 RepID=A0AAN9YAT4_9HEMI
MASTLYFTTKISLLAGHVYGSRCLKSTEVMKRKTVYHSCPPRVFIVVIPKLRGSCLRGNLLKRANYICRVRETAREPQNETCCPQKNISAEDENENKRTAAATAVEVRVTVFRRRGYGLRLELGLELDVRVVNLPVGRCKGWWMLIVEVWVEPSILFPYFIFCVRVCESRHFFFWRQGGES